MVLKLPPAGEVEVEARRRGTEMVLPSFDELSRGRKTVLRDFRARRYGAAMFGSGAGPGQHSMARNWRKKAGWCR
jgi:hypothetical protein